MADFTRKAIRQSLIRLLEERPLNKITVKDIVEDCGINRNSFYYHFQDIPAVIEDIVTEEADRIIEAYPSIDSIEQGLEVAVEFALANRRSMLHIFNSVQRDTFERYLWRVCDHVVSRYFDLAMSGRAVRESDRPIIINFYKCECFGQIIAWLDSGMREDIRAPFRRVCALCHGMTEELISRSSRE